MNSVRLQALAAAQVVVLIGGVVTAFVLDPGSRHQIRWGVSAYLSSALTIHEVSSPCDSDIRMSVHETQDEVTIDVTALVGHGTCSADARVAIVTVPLSAELGDRALLGCAGPDVDCRVFEP